MEEAVLWWRKQCYGKGSSVMLKEAVLRWKKQCYGGGSNVMVE